MRVFHVFHTLIALLHSPFITAVAVAAMIPEGNPECQSLPGLKAPGAASPLRNRYNTGSACGYLVRDQLRLWFQIAPAVEAAENAPWLIFINGGPGIADGFRDPQFLKLRDKYNLVWFNQRGTGLSHLTLAQTSDCKVASLDQNVQDLRALQLLLSPNRPVVLIAHSWGGLIAQEFAAFYPSAIMGLIMSGTGPGFEFAHHAFINGNKSLYPYHDFLVGLLGQASPEIVKRYKAAEAIIAAHLKNGVPVHLAPDNRADRMYAPQFIVALKNYFGRIDFDAVPALKLVEGIAAGQISPNGLADLGIETAGTNHILNNTILCGDGLPGMLQSLPKEMGQSMSRGCAEITPGCQNDPVDFEALPRRISAPTLILAGTADQVSPVEDQRRLAGLITGARIVELAGAQHGEIMEPNFTAFPQILSFLGVASNWTPQTWQGELR